MNFEVIKSVQIHFIDEVAQDVGGVFREWHTSLFNEILSEKYNFFYDVKNSYGPSGIFIPTTKVKNIKENTLEYYNFIGKVLAKGIYDKNLLKFNLHRILIKHLLELDITLEDLRYLDNDVK